ncbi:thioesterase II family protein [Streptomyces rimosus]|uniref:thioesterase II family protein n=1 Tax=Streptomyces rimosus TaxID=1927 RepID=UPI00067AD86D|nr:alpha/beta fold hydrolase [Streptomyces rimosus]
MLVCFHHAGGGTALFRGWQEHLGQDIAVWPVLLPGRERRIREPRRTDPTVLVQELAGELGPLLDRPYAFFGHSMGALIAHRLVALRQDRGERLPAALITSACAPPLSPVHFSASRLSDDELVAQLGRVGGIPEQLLEHPEWLRLALPVIRDDLGLCRPYPGETIQPLPVPIHVCGGAEDRLVGESELRGWHALTEAGGTLAMFAGDHFYVNQRPVALFQHLRALLSGAVTAG